MSGKHRPAVVGAIVLIVLAAWTAARLRIATDIAYFLPAGGADLELRLARDLAFGELSRTMVLVVRAPSAQDAPQVSRDMEAALRAEPRVADAATFVEAAPPAGVEEALWDLYGPRRFGFAADDAESARAAISDEALERSVLELRAKLTSPMSSLLTRVAPGDPLLVLPRLFERLQAGRAEGVAVVDGRFVADGGASAVLFCATRAPSSDNAAQRPFLEGIAAAFGVVDAKWGGALTLEQSGANRYGIRMERSIRDDIGRVSIGSTLLLAGLFLVLFRSLRLFLLVLPVLGSGFLAGTSACLAFFGEVHGVTLAFGAALIGVSVDYAVHFNCHQALVPDPRGPRATLATIWPGLALGAATTVVGFVALLLSSFPGLRELALFSAFGIAAALLATRAFLPSLMPGDTSVGSSRALSRWLGVVLARPRTTFRRWLLLAPTVAAVATAIVGLPRARWDDSLARLNRLDPALVEEDESVRSRIARFDQSHIAVATGLNDEQALVVDDRVTAVLERCERDGIVAGRWGAGLLLPSAARQREVDAVLRGDSTLCERTRAALEANGFVAAAFEPFCAALAAPAPEPLTWDDIANSAMAPLVRTFRVQLPGSGGDTQPLVGFVSFVREVRDAGALRERLEAVGAHLIDIEGELTDAYAGYRKRMSSLLTLGLVGVVMLVVLRHALPRSRSVGRVLRASAVACVPALLGAAATVAVLALLGVALNLLSLVALLVVASMGVDYGAFLVEPTRGAAEREATYLSVVVAGVSTIFGFGLLALSDQPALRGIGLTCGIGVLLCLALATTMRAVTLPPEQVGP